MTGTEPQTVPGQASDYHNSCENAEKMLQFKRFEAYFSAQNDKFPKPGTRTLGPANPRHTKVSDQHIPANKVSDQQITGPTYFRIFCDFNGPFLVRSLVFHCTCIREISLSTGTNIQAEIL